MQLFPDTPGPASPEERRRYLLGRLERDGRIVAADVIREIGVSEDTIRRDLNELAAAGLVERVHGGALPVSREREGFVSREQQAPVAKSRIGRRAAELILPGQVVLMDSGTTIRAVAEALPASLRATIVTTSLPLALDLCDHPGIQVIMPGGRLDTHDRTIGGLAAYETIRSIRADLCLLGVCGLDPDMGIGANDPEEAHLKRAMIDSARQTYALADADKFRTIAPFRVAPIERLSGIVVDADAPREQLARFAGRGLDIITA